ncbi:Putative oxidoreductase MhqP [Candidatus Thermoflexus japonica]|uniref:Oxidoreductase MhqP n=1 Tax=Candidatus Thermoflexus japonica TaxID=2035417 RepID=A0A2H5Y3I8_9CHLR|nr:Putative oxidoreductase MhqP [Candidatus Thermoflexus japonica]
MVRLDLGLAILRVLIGLLFAGHGAQKLFGGFGGHGLNGTAAWLESLNIRPGRPWALLLGLGEFVGGLFLALGLATPWAILPLLASQLVALIRVHAPKGLWIDRGGFEYNLVLIALSAFFGFYGAGAYSADAWLGWVWPQPTTFGLVLILALLIALVALAAPVWAPRLSRRAA